MSRRIVLATPHQRYDALETRLLTVHGLDVVRLRARDELDVAVLARHQPTYVVFPHWSWKIPTEIHSSYECIVFHMTDVPFGRGGSPLQNLIVRGVEQTVLTALRCVDEMDAGPVYLKRPLSTLGSAEEVFVRAAALMEDMLVQIVSEDLKPQPQDGDVVRFERRKPEQSDMRSAASLGQVHDLIRMLDAEGYPHAFIEVGNLRFEFTRAARYSDHVAADVKISLLPGKGES